MTNTLRVERAIKHMTQQQLAEANRSEPANHQCHRIGKVCPFHLAVIENIRDIRKDCK